MTPLSQLRLVSLAVNLPGPLAAARLRDLGAAVLKVEPPDGDPLAAVCPDWYRELHRDVEVLRLDLKNPADRRQLDDRLAAADLLLTAVRPAALRRVGLTWDDLHPRYPRLLFVSLVGYPPPDDDRPGHDLTYQADAGLLTPPALPRALLADWAGAQDAVEAALALVLARERGQGAQCCQVSLAAAAERFAAPFRRGLTRPGAPLGGGLPGYGLYRTADGWLAVAALEPHFWRQLLTHLGLAAADADALQAAFLTRTARQWQEWARSHGLPMAALAD